MRFHYASGMARNIARDFSFLALGKLGRLEITDRYMAAGHRQKDALESFIGAIADLWSVPPAQIVFWHGPARDLIDRGDWIRTMDEVIRNLRADARFEDTKFRNEFRGSMRVRNFHDRRVVAHFLDAGTAQTNQDSSPTPRRRRRNRQRTEDAIRRTITAELTGGIDLLMNNREETTVFVIEPEN